MGERCKLPHRGLGQLCNFYNVEVTKHRIIIIIKVGGGGGGAVRFRSDAFLWHTENTLSFIINGYNFDRGVLKQPEPPPCIRHCTT